MPFQMLLCSQVHRKFERPWVPRTSSLVCRAFDLSRQWHAHDSLPARVTGSVVILAGRLDSQLCRKMHLV